MSPKPVAKANLIRQQILAGLVATRPTSWVHKKLVDESDPKSDVAKARVTHTELVNPLAQNMSDANLNILAKRWLRVRYPKSGINECPFGMEQEGV